MPVSDVVSDKDREDFNHEEDRNVSARALRFALAYPLCHQRAHVESKGLTNLHTTCVRLGLVDQSLPAPATLWTSSRFVVPSQGWRTTPSRSAFKNVNLFSLRHSACRKSSNSGYAADAVGAQASRASTLGIRSAP